jgi:hypothetical protein
MTDFIAGDEVVYILRGKPTYYATVIEVCESNRMWVKWKDDCQIKTQLIDCDNFELLNRRRNER